LKTSLPITEGVGPSSIWLPAGPWKTVLDFLRQRFPQVGVATWIARMSNGEVVDERGLRLNAESSFREGACIYYYRELENETVIPFSENVLYEDEHLLVIDKPHFLPVVPAGRFLRETLLVRLRRKGQPESLAPIHRLDRDTAGLVLFSMNPQTRGLYTALFRERKVDKVYEALARTSASMTHLSFPLTRSSRIVRGEPFFRMQEVEGEPNSETRIELLESSGDQTRCRLIPITGKKHQLRLHLAALGMPIVNDKLYPAYVRELHSEYDFSRPLKLLAKSIAFQDPVTGRKCYFESSRQL
jgi:tRNA pseudouridine32 synthase / 23S rRNA pseudouridine746 synthase